MAERLDRWLTPRMVFAALALLVALAVIFSPEPDVGARGGPLTTYSAAPYGGRVLYEALGRLGWNVQRRTLALHGALDTTATYAIVGMRVQPTRFEVARLLHAVRQGASLLVVPEEGSLLADSLGVETAGFSFQTLTVGQPRAGRRGRPGRSWDSTPVPAVERRRERSRDLTRADSDAATDELRADNIPLRTAIRPPNAITPARELTALPEMHFYLTASNKSDNELEGTLPDSAVTLLQVASLSGMHPGVIGFPLGRGRVVAVADATLLANDALGTGDTGILAVRLFEWLQPHGQRAIIFDEYHQGYGRHADVEAAIERALFTTPAGRMATQGVIAALILILAVGIRPIPPRPRQTIERRSPLEHVGALAQAYAQIGATPLATRRLLRGLRRRHPLGASTAIDDDDWLQALVARLPALTPQVTLLRDAVHRRRTDTDFAAVGDAIASIERTLIT